MKDNIRRAVETDVLDYQQLMDCLKGYAKPRDKVRAMLKAGEIVRVKKGIYVFGEDYRRAARSREILANLIYGPSYISRAVRTIFVEAGERTFDTSA